MIELNKTHKTILSFAGGFLIGALIIWAWSVILKQPRLDVPAETTAPSDMEAPNGDVSDGSGVIIGETITETNASTNTENDTPARILVSAQDAGATVLLDSLTLPLNGWAVVHEEQAGYIGNALGAVRKDVGTYNDVRVSLLRSTEPATRYWVVLYSDNGDRLFNLRDDFPIRDANSDPVLNAFTTN